MSQRSKFIGGFILGIVLGSGALFIYITPTLTRYELMRLDNIELEQDNDILVENIASLIDDIIELEDDIIEFEDDYQAVQIVISNLNSDLSQLENENSGFTDELKYANENWRSLSEHVIAFREELYSYCRLNESFTRIFTPEGITAISDKVESVTRNDGDFWDGINRIHKYVRDEVTYAYDSSVPVIGSYTYFGEKDSPLITKFETHYQQELFQPLSFTVEYEQGDCDDQAIYEFAMIKYYQRYILDEEYRLFLVHIAWENSAHLTVFQPVSGGKITILDPAGKYQTGSTFRLDAKSARSELFKYQNYWVDENGPILEVKMYTIDIDDGRHVFSFSGSLEEVIEFFEL